MAQTAIASLRKILNAFRALNSKGIDSMNANQTDLLARILKEVQALSLGGAIADGSITAVKLASDSVTTIKILDANVTTPKIADANVTPAKLSGGQSGAAPAYACRAWVNFNGSGTVTIRASGNVSSITDNGVGDYTVNFTTALPNANYAAVITPAKRTGFSAQGALLGYQTADPTTTALRFNCLAFDATANIDMDFVNVAIFG